MTRPEIVHRLRQFIHTLRIDPHDAGLVLQQVDDNGGVVDHETLADYLDGAGYPELAHTLLLEEA